MPLFQTVYGDWSLEFKDNLCAASSLDYERERVRLSTNLDFVIFSN